MWEYIWCLSYLVLSPPAQTLAFMGNLSNTLVWCTHDNTQNSHPCFLSKTGSCEDLLFQFSSSQRQKWSRGLLNTPHMHPLQHDAHVQQHLSLHELSYLQGLTLAGVWIQMAALNRMWSHSCLSNGAPCVRPSRYFAKERKCSNTALVMCARDDCVCRALAWWSRSSWTTWWLRWTAQKTNVSLNKSWHHRISQWVEISSQQPRVRLSCEVTHSLNNVYLSKKHLSQSGNETHKYETEETDCFSKQKCKLTAFKNEMHSSCILIYNRGD